jgi:putative tryptophan/tyrosine transport system substrate-binding protein
MRRREVLSLLAGALAACPVPAIAQQAERMRVIGVLIGFAESDPDIPLRIAAFEQGLRELGWIEGRNIRIHYRFGFDSNRLQEFAKELVALQPDLIVASSGLVVFALLRETRTAPIVFVTTADPVGDGFVASLARPGGNTTGFTNNLSSMGEKWLQLLKEIAPGIERVAIMFNPDTAPGGGGSYFLLPFETAAASIAVKPVAMPVRSPADIESSLAGFGHGQARGLVLMPDNFTSLHRERIIAAAAQHRVPAIYPFRFFAMDGGLMSYGTDLLDLYRRVPAYVDRILKGAKPADLPVQAAAKVDLVINLKTAKALGLSVPRIMIARANEVIE